MCMYVSLFKLGYNILKATGSKTWVDIHQKHKYKKTRINWMLNVQELTLV